MGEEYGHIMLVAIVGGLLGCYLYLTKIMNPKIKLILEGDNR